MSDDPELTLDEIEEARAEEEFISEPEDTVNNPLVPSASGGMTISSGNIMHGDFTGGSDKPINNETNMKGEIVGNQEGSIFDKPKATAEPAPAEEGAPIFGKKKVVKQEPVAAPAPAPAPAEQPVVAAAPAGAAPKKKSKAGLIVTLCIIFVLLIGGGVAAFLWLMSREAPETMVNDAIAKIYESENFGVTSSIDVEGNGVEGKFDFDIAKAGENLKLEGTLKIDGAKLEIDAIQYKSETYLKVEGLSNIDIVSYIKKTEAGSSLTGAQGTMLEKVFKYVGEAVEGSWVKFDASMISGLLGNSGDCSVDVSTLLDTDTSKVKDAYEDNAFIARDDKTDVVEKDGVKYIKVKIDKEKSKSFGKALLGDKCTVKSDDSSEEKDYSITLGVKPWSHDLSVIRINDGKKDYDLKVDFDKKDITKPEGAKSILTLGTDVEKAFKKAMSESAEAITKETCQSNYGAYGSAYVEMCIEQTLPTVKNYFEQMNIGELFAPLIQNIMGKIGGSTES